jgi:UDP-glucuronate 4-epimerase
MRCLVTGTAGFIGFHLARRLLEQGYEVAGVDGLTPYYDVKLKADRQAQLEKHDGFSPHLCKLEAIGKLRTVFERFAPELVFHLAAQPGVRYSLENPRSYIDSNIVGSFNILELCREVRPKHLLMASTSSVYGASTDFPLAETDRADHPLTVYAATKKSVESLSHCYAHLWGIPITTFRFFTAYGPWGRPDMAPFKFVQNILAGRPIDVYNHGNMERDFTFIDDLVEAIVRLSERIPTSAGGTAGINIDSSSPVGPYRVVNIGGGHPVNLLRFIEEIERALGRKAERNYMGMQPGEVLRTEASTELLKALIGYLPETPIEVGVPKFVSWYREYYRV